VRAGLFSGLMRRVMALFDWKDEYSIGISSIDTHHKKLICLINEILESMRDRRAETLIRDILRELEQYAVYHFSLEERLFQRYRYPKTKEHQDAHNLFIRKIEFLIDIDSINEEDVPILTFNFLRNWLDSHILKADMDFGNFISNNGINVE